MSRVSRGEPSGATPSQSPKSSTCKPEVLQTHNRLQLMVGETDTDHPRIFVVRSHIFVFTIGRWHVVVKPAHHPVRPLSCLEVEAYKSRGSFRRPPHQHVLRSPTLHLGTHGNAEVASVGIH